ncbi:MAG: ATP-binding protein [Desulfovibrionaceae bacterium]|nr:ATP-binding protein [Desulfovibrionaceae bacterium]
MYAEGHRKLGMLAYLIKNGSIERGSTLLWDEPEANLNPKLIKELAAVLVVLSQDVQIIIATHSLFLLRELEILEKKKSNYEDRYFSLYFSKNEIAVQQGDTSNDIGNIDCLDASLDQSQRYLDAAHEE